MRASPPSPPRTGIVGDAVPAVPFRAVLVLLCRGGRLCPPEQREALSFRASDRVTGVGIRFSRTDKNWFRIFHKKEIAPCFCVNNMYSA